MCIFQFAHAFANLSKICQIFGSYYHCVNVCKFCECWKWERWVKKGGCFSAYEGDKYDPDVAAADDIAADDIDDDVGEGDDEDDDEDEGDAWASRESGIWAHMEAINMRPSCIIASSAHHTTLHTCLSDSK